MIARCQTSFDQRPPNRIHGFRSKCSNVLDPCCVLSFESLLFSCPRLAPLSTAGTDGSLVYGCILLEQPTPQAGRPFHAIGGPGGMPRFALACHHTVVHYPRSGSDLDLDTGSQYLACSPIRWSCRSQRYLEIAPGSAINLLCLEWGAYAGQELGRIETVRIATGVRASPIVTCARVAQAITLEGRGAASC